MTLSMIFSYMFLNHLENKRKIVFEEYNGNMIIKQIFRICLFYFKVNNYIINRFSSINLHDKVNNKIITFYYTLEGYYLEFFLEIVHMFLCLFLSMMRKFMRNNKKGKTLLERIKENQLKISKKL